MTVDLEKIVKTDQQYLIHPLYHPNDAKNPFVWIKGEGSILRAADGREYIDGLAGLWNVTLGHGRKELAEAAARQMEQLTVLFSLCAVIPLGSFTVSVWPVQVPVPPIRFQQGGEFPLLPFGPDPF